MSQNQDNPAFYDNRRFAGKGNVSNMLGATGEIAVILRNITKDELGATGLAIRNLSVELIEYGSVIGKYASGINWEEKINTIGNTLQDMPGIGHMNMSTLAAVIVFLHATRAINTEIIDFTGNFDIYKEVLTVLFNSIDIRNNMPKSSKSTDITTVGEYESIAGIDNQLILLKYKQTFVRYIYKLLTYASSIGRRINQIL